MKKEIVKLSSSKPMEYSGVEVECFAIDDVKKYVEYLLSNGAKHFTASKEVPVTARKGEVGQDVKTVVGVEVDGKNYIMEETNNTVKVEGSMIVRNPDGEEYVVKPDKFADKYTATEKEGVFMPKSSPVNCIEVKENIVFDGPWGGKMYALKGAVLNISNMEEIYAIQNTCFKATYKKIEKEQEREM